MKYDLTFSQDEIRLTLSESLALAEGQSAQLGSPTALAVADLLPKIEAQVHQFLKGFVAVRGE